ncbi:MAG: DUF3800 domain-containing protein [Bradyrhizobium sp.]
MPRKPWEPREFERLLFHEVYIDETSQNDHHFLLMGGIVMPLHASEQFTADMIEARSPRLRRLNSKGHLPEMGWSEVSSGDFEEYKTVLDAYFSFGGRRLQNRPGVYKFYCSVINTRIPGRSYTGKKGAVGFNREIYFHCLNVARHDKAGLFHVYPDERSTSDPIEKMAFMLSRGMRKEGDKRDHPFRRMAFRKSHECIPLQISDILIGAIAYRLNRHYDAPKANADKKRLCDYVLERTKLDRNIGANSFRQKRWSQYQLWYRRHKT